MSDLTSGIRRAAAPQRPRGPAVPTTSGTNSGDPTLQAPAPSRTVGGVAPSFPKSDTGHKSLGWHELTDVEVRAYTETMVALIIGAGETLTVDPTRCQIWRVMVNGAGSTIVIPKPEFPTAATPRQDAPERRRTWSCVLIVNAVTSDSFPTISGALWGEKLAHPDISNPDGSDPVDRSGTYVFSFLYDPVSDVVYGFEGGLRF